MKAFEVRKASIQPQYDHVMEEIETARKMGWTSTTVGFPGPMYPEVAERLAAEGFDVEMQVHCSSVLWENAEEGKAGKVTYVNEANTEKQKRPDVFQTIVLSRIDLENGPEEKNRG